jgi:hypothetical protein
LHRDLGSVKHGRIVVEAPVNTSWLDLLGYAASVVILISLMMSSIIKLRWVNLAGSILFATFGFLIGSLPTGGLNAGIVIINIYYLVKLYHERDELAIVPADPESDYFAHVWKTNHADIERYAGEVTVTQNDEAFFLLRNNNTAGVLVGRRDDPATLTVVVDYVTPEHRDFRVGEYLFKEGHIRDALPDITRVLATGGNDEHAAYLRKLGFIPRDSEIWEREIS